MLDITPFIGYIKHKLIRFTGFRLSKIVECGDFIKNKKRIKTKQCAPGWARISAKILLSEYFFMLDNFAKLFRCLVRDLIYYLVLVLLNKSKGFTGDFYNGILCGALVGEFSANSKLL